MGAVYNIAADQGATYGLTVIAYQPGTLTGATPVPLNLTGYGAHMQVRPAAGDPLLVLDISTTNGWIVITPLTGTVRIDVPAKVMTLVPAGSYKYDLEIYSSAATPVVTRLIQGSFKVNAEVTIL